MSSPKGDKYEAFVMDVLKSEIEKGQLPFPVGQTILMSQKNRIMEYNLDRFIVAQSCVYPTALKELQQGQKRSHWMWYIFPQLKHLGHSYNSEYYGISGIEEAKAYLENPVLAQRLREVSDAILNLPTNNPVEVFGGIDSRKLCSSMTLFDLASPNDIFARVLDKYFNGKHDIRTIHIVHTY